MNNTIEIGNRQVYLFHTSRRESNESFESFAGFWRYTPGSP